MTRPATNQDIRVTSIVICALMTALFLLHQYSTDNRLENNQQPIMCQEDEVIVGVGDFSDGTWGGYRCENREEVN